MTGGSLLTLRVLAAAVLALLCLLIPLDASAQPNLPSAPTIDNVTARAGWLLVKWSVPITDGGSAITAYDVRRIEADAADKADANWTETHDAWTTGGGDLVYALRGLANDTEYDVQVRAVNANGDGEWSMTATGTPESSEKTSSTIAIVRGDDGAIVVTWNAPTETVARITAYDVRYILTSADETVDGNWTVEEDAWVGGRREYAITDLDNGAAYDVQVRHVDRFGDGPWSETMSATPADFGNSETDAADVALQTGSSGRLVPLGSLRYWGKIDSETDADWFKLEITSAQAPDPVGFWLYTLGDLDTVGQLFSSDGTTLTTLEFDDYGGVLPEPENFFIWQTLSAGTYYVKITGFGSETGDYLFRVRNFYDTTRTVAFGLPLGSALSSMIDPKTDEDWFELDLSHLGPSEQKDVILRASGFPDTEGTLYTSGGTAIYNDDGYLIPGAFNFLIRTTLGRGKHYLKVGSFADRSDGPFSVYATEATDPGSTTAEAAPLTLRDAGGGNITASDDVDYFSITVDEPTFVRIWTSKRPGNVDTDGVLLDDNGDAVTPLDFSLDFSEPVGFGIEHRLEASTYPATFYVKVTPDSSSDIGKYVIRASEDTQYQRFVDNCSGISQPAGVADQYSGCQWHLDNRSQFGTSPGEDINVLSVWGGGNLGDGITVAVVDDGMDYQHEDLDDNVELSKNHDYTGSNEIYRPYEFHGTSVAGLISADDNAIGMRGVAPDATIYGYNLLVSRSDSDVNDAMSRHADTTAIYNNSWGPQDVAGPQSAPSMWAMTVEDAVASGYGGKGVLYVWSGGNGARRGDDSNLDEYNNHYAVTSVCAVNYSDTRTAYSEPGVNLWVCAPSDDSAAPDIATTDNGNRYTDSFGGTSAAAPIVSGVAALIRNANNSLTWRDVKIILAASARKNDPDNTGWDEGADKYGSTGKYNFNREYGFGAVDAQAAVTLASVWTNLPPFRESTARSRSTNLSIPDATTTDMGMTVTQGEMQTSELTLDANVAFIEYIHVDTHFNHTSFRDLKVVLESPDGTKSTLSPQFDVDTTHLRVPRIPLTNQFRFGSAKHLGEAAEGTWKLHITDHYLEDTGRLRSWSITAYGHGIRPVAPDIDELFPASGGFTVTWKAPDDTGRSNIARYDVRHILSSATDTDKADDTKWTVNNVGNPDPPQYIARDLTAATKYDVQVRAVNSETDGEGPWSETATVTPTTDEAPTIDTITPGNGMLAIAWVAPTSSTLGTIDSYDLRYIRSNASNKADAFWAVVKPVWTSGSANPLEYTLNPTPALANGTSYDVQVRAVVGTTEHPWSATRTGTPRTVPGAPTIGSVDGDEGKLAVEWNAPSEDGGANVTSYDVRYIRSAAADKVDGNWTEQIGVVDGTAGDEKYVATGLTNWVKYDVQVRAVNLAGHGEWSATETGTPTNTDVRVTLEWEDTSVDVDEDGGTVTLTAIATTDQDQALPSDFFFDATVVVAEGSATDSDDYVPASTTTLTFSQADNDFTRMEINGRQRYRAIMDFTVGIVNDTDDESDETFTATLTLANPDISNLRLGNARATVTIEDDEHVPVELGWANDSVSVNEGSSTVALDATATTTVNKRPESGFSFQATVSTSDGIGSTGADAPEDYTHVSTTVTFQDSDSWSAVGSGADRRYRASKRITVPIINDDIDERDEAFTATVSYVDSVPIHLTGGSADVAVTIEDNDLPKVSIKAATDTADEDQTLLFDLTRVGILNDALTVNVGVSETGSMLASNQPTTATFSANASATTLDIALTDDTEDEDNSVVTVTVRSGSGYVPVSQPPTMATATATAIDDDHVPVTLSWDRTAITVAERAGEVTLRAVATTTKDKAPESGFSFGVNVTYANGTAQSADYSGGPTSATFSQSDFSRSGTRYRATRDFTINIISGDGDEADETFTATLAYAADPLPPHLQGNSPTATVTITDDDDPLVTITADDLTVTEVEDSITFTVVRDGDAASSLSVNVDVEESGGSMLARVGRYTVSFAAGSSRETLTVNLRDDTEDEDDSKVTAEVINGSGYFPGSPGSAETTVTDDDHVPVALEWEETTLVVGEGVGTVSLTAVVTTTKDKAPDDGFTVSVAVTVADGSATDPEDYEPPSGTTLSFSAGSGFSQETIDGESRYQATETFDITIKGDDDDEPDENFTARLAWETPAEPHLGGSSSTARVTITDDDPVPLVLGWERPEWSVEESDGTVTLKAVAITTINRMPEEGFSFEARVDTSDGSAREGSDFTGLSVRETFLRSDFSRAAFDGQSRYRAEKEFTVAVVADGNGESNESFSVRLSYDGPTHANLATGVAEATVWIIEDDADTADVQLARDSAPGGVSQGAGLTYEYTVSNDGPATATGLELVVHLDPHVSVRLGTLPIGCGHLDGTVSCSVDDLDAGESAEIAIEVIVDAVPGDGIVNWGYVSGSVADPTPGNNTYPATATGGGGGGSGGGGGGGGIAPLPAVVAQAELDRDPADIAIVGEWELFTVTGGGLERVEVRLNTGGSVGALTYSLEEVRPEVADACPAEGGETPLAFTVLLDQEFGLGGCREGEVSIELRNAEDGSVLGEYRATVGVITEEEEASDELGMPEGVSAAYAEESGLVEVWWSVAANASGYIIIAINIDDINNDVVAAVLNDGDLETGSIGGLRPGASYDVYVAATGSRGRFTLSEAVRVLVPGSG